MNRERTMRYQLAEVNIAKFRLPMDHPVNREFIDNLDRVNAIAEIQPGFVWRLVGQGNNALDLQAFADPNIAVNLSVWADLESLARFVYQNAAHIDIMKRRREWFDKIDFHLALWWIPADHRPTVDEAKSRLRLIEVSGSTTAAFRFNRPFPPPCGAPVTPILDTCV
jgi:hypothetical protein